MVRIATFSLIAVVVIVVAVLGWRGKKSTDPPFQPFMDMVAQPRYEPQGASRFFADGRSQRPPPANTVAWGRNPQQADAEFVAHDEDLFALQHIPLPLDRALILRGQQKYDLFCTVCHGGTGAGNGITTQYGMNAPPSYHTDRLRSHDGRRNFSSDLERQGADGTVRRSHCTPRPLGDCRLHPRAAALTRRVGRGRA